MKQEEHLKLIRAKCVKLLEIASKRSGDYLASPELQRPDYEPFAPGGTLKIGPWTANTSCNDAAFIAAAAGTAEAGWYATIAAIDAAIHIGSIDLSPCNGGSCMVATEADEQMESAKTFLANSIIAAWPQELL